MMEARSLWQIARLGARGRGVVAQRDLRAGTSVMRGAPIAQVLKHSSKPTDPLCHRCLKVAPTRLTHSHGRSFCGAECAETDAAMGGELLSRCDMSELETIHREQDRKFPLLACSLLGALLEGFKRQGNPPQVWVDAMGMCFANMEPEATSQLEVEHRLLGSLFTRASITTDATLQLLLPLQRYMQLLGAAQLNAFELRTSHGLHVSCLLSSQASCFNHSCDPNVLVSVGESHHVNFVTGREVAAGTELCISYVDPSMELEARRQILLYKYGFDCNCGKCAAERGSSPSLNSIT